MRFALAFIRTTRRRNREWSWETMASLRERKKLETRAKLVEVTLDLAARHGLAHVKVEDIAAAANVSPRTFNNYFPSKEAAIIGSAEDRGKRIAEALLASPKDMDIQDAARAAILTQFPEVPDKAWLAQLMLIRRDPNLVAEQRRADSQAEDFLATAVAQREGIPLDEEIFPRMLAATLVAAIHAAMQHWLASEARAPFRTTLEEALGRLVIAPAPRST